jgi:ATP-binding cassette subfamily B protein
VLISSLGFAILHGTRDLAVALVDLTQHIARLGEVTQTLLIPHEMTERDNTQRLQIERATVDFDNVSFAYSGRRPLLSAFNLHIRAGERVGLIGPSGAGKSTIFALIQHFYEPETGSVRISGQDISRVPLHSLQAAISIVPQARFPLSPIPAG